MVHHKSTLFIVCLLMMGVLVACDKTSTGLKYSEIPASGDAEHGKTIFNTGLDGSPACSSCHTLDAAGGVGPGFVGLQQRASTRVANQSAREYLFSSITQPSSYIVAGYTNVMYQEYGKKLGKQDIADVLAYLLETPAGQ